MQMILLLKSVSCILYKIGHNNVTLAFIKNAAIRQHRQRKIMASCESIL